jgi:hypothetical protein
MIADCGKASSQRAPSQSSAPSHHSQQSIQSYSPGLDPYSSALNDGLEQDHELWEAYVEDRRARRAEESGHQYNERMEDWMRENDEYLAHLDEKWRQLLLEQEQGLR